MRVLFLSIIILTCTYVSADQTQTIGYCAVRTSGRPYERVDIAPGGPFHGLLPEYVAEWGDFRQKFPIDEKFTLGIYWNEGQISISVYEGADGGALLESKSAFPILKSKADKLDRLGYEIVDSHKLEISHLVQLGFYFQVLCTPTVTFNSKGCSKKPFCREI